MEEKEAAPLISVVIPAYNHEQFVGTAIDSVLAQSISDFELIVIDDGSTDATAAVVEAFDDPRLRFYQQSNQDAYNTINRGISMATGEFIAILNSDDLYDSDRFACLLDFIRTTEAAGTVVEALFTDVIPISGSGEEFTDPAFAWNIWHRNNRDFYHACGDLYTAFLNGNLMVTTSNLFMRRRAAEKVGAFAALRWLHDYDYIFRLLLAFPQGVHYLHSDRLVCYRIHGGNTLGEAAVTGRRQDQELISRYMSAAVPEEYRSRVQTGAARLVTLGDELHQVQQQLLAPEPVGVRPAAQELAGAVRRWVGKKLKGGQ